MSEYQTEQSMVCHALEGASGSSVRVYQYLRNAQLEARRHGRQWIMPRQQTIADDLGRHRRTIQRAIADLARRGLLVVQARFKRLLTGEWRQVSNRMRVMLTTAAVATRTLLVRTRASLLTKSRPWYRCDIPVAPRIREDNNKPWQTSDLYRNLMAKGLRKVG